MDKPNQKKKNKKSEKQKDKQPNSLISQYTSIVIKMAAVILAGVYGGQWADDQVGMEFPLFTLILSIVSVAIAIYIIIIDTR